MYDKKISVITPTIRPKGLEIVSNSLENQLFEDFEWIICSPFKPKVSYPHEWLKDDFKGGFWSLNRAYNRCFKWAIGELIVSWQDWIWADSDALQKFWYRYNDVKGCITGVGDQYDQLDEYGKPTNKVWDDPRKNSNHGDFYECTWPDMEYNFCATPKDLIKQVGGADERLDHLGFGADMYSVSERINDVDGKFFIDQTNESFTLRHGREHKTWDEEHVLFNGQYDRRKEQLIERGVWPKLQFLD